MPFERVTRYKKLYTAEDFIKRIAEIIDAVAEAACKSKLSAAVYTQISDVEQEINGLLTYSRHPKLPASSIYHIVHKFRKTLFKCGWATIEPPVVTGKPRNESFAFAHIYQQLDMIEASQAAAA